MHLAWGAIVLEDIDVVDAVPRFASITDPPHGSILPNTIAAYFVVEVLEVQDAILPELRGTSKSTNQRWAFAEKKSMVA